jgi:hypothetical protein
MVTRLKKRPAAKATPAPSKAKRASSKAPPRATRGASSASLESLLAALPPLTNVQRHAFRDQWSLQQCDDAGELSKAADVYREALAWAPIIDRALSRAPHAIRRYSKARFTWFLECVRDLGDAIEAQRSGNASPDVAKERAARARSTALAMREELIEALSVLAGGDILQRRVLEAASGTTDTPEALASSLRALCRLAEGWLEQESPGARALVASVDLTPADVDAARAATHALAFVAHEAAHGVRSDRDGPAVNRVEGRVVLEMRLLLRVFERARPHNRLVPKLTPSPALRDTLRPTAGAATGRELPPTLEQPVTAREGTQVRSSA